MISRDSLKACAWQGCRSRVCGGPAKRKLQGIGSSYDAHVSDSALRKMSESGPRLSTRHPHFDGRYLRDCGPHLLIASLSARDPHRPRLIPNDIPRKIHSPWKLTDSRIEACRRRSGDYGMFCEWSLFGLQVCEFDNLTPFFSFGCD